jgi:hypothetical protein
MMTIAHRGGWGWLLLVALTLSTIGDEITLITLMFRSAGDQAALAVPRYSSPSSFPACWLPLISDV